MHSVTSNAVAGEVNQLASSEQSWDNGNVGGSLYTGLESFFITAFYNTNASYSPVPIVVKLGGPVAGALVMRHELENVGGSMIIFGYLWDRPIFCRIKNHQIMAEYYL